MTIAYEEFKFAHKFINLTLAQFENAWSIVEVQFSGVNKLWGFLPPLEAEAKRELCFNYLIADIWCVKCGSHAAV